MSKSSGNFCLRPPTILFVENKSSLVSKHFFVIIYLNKNFIVPFSKLSLKIPYTASATKNSVAVLRRNPRGRPQCTAFVIEP